jgi:hypothetical protein
MWPFKSGPNRDVGPSYLAEQLYLNAVTNETSPLKLNDLLKDLHLNLSEDTKQLFVAKYLIYREATVLRVLLTENRRNEKLLREFERLVFGSTATETARIKLGVIKSAMKNLDELFAQRRKDLRWARNWLLDIGCDETNPATLTMFALIIGADTKILRELIQELG